MIGDWDPAVIRRVLTNLISNALKYAREGPIEISAAAVDGSAVLRIADQGIGLLPDEIARVERATREASAGARSPASRSPVSRPHRPR